MRDDGADGQAVVCPLLRASSGNERGRANNCIRAPALTSSVTLTRARALMARPWSARCYGVARQREGSRQNSMGGSGVLSLRHFGLVLFIPLARGCRRICRGERCKLWLMVSAGAMLLDRLGPPGFRFIDFRAPALTSSVTLTRARALMARPWSARCYGVARQREGSRQNSMGARACFSPAFRAGSLSLWRVGAEESAAAKDANYGLWFRPARCCSTGLGRRDLDLLISGPPR